ncbi:hypothetical protein P7C71_g5856, partial [Lecanoromycetidae sp. Uapishka_2]
MKPSLASVLLAVSSHTFVAFYASGSPVAAPDVGPLIACTPGLEVEWHQIGNTPSPVWPYQIFKSSPYNPPELQITTNGKPLAPGLLFFSPSEGGVGVAAKDVAPLIMTDTGELVFNGPSVAATNFRVAQYRGSPILTYWTGESTSGENIGHGYGNVTFLDSSYNSILVLCPQLDLVTPDNVKFECEADLHESFVTDRNTILVTAYNVTETDLSAIGGPKNGWIFDCLFFELDPANGNIIFRWSAIEHVSVRDTKEPLVGTGNNQSAPFDWFHINSVINIGDDYLVNSRHLWATFLITANGDIIWRLQGDTGGDFGALPANGHFSWQHYARPHHITNTSIRISYFNNFNQALDNGTNPSNGLELQLTLPPNKASPPVVLEQLLDTSDLLYADSQGSAQFLPNGNIFLDYGAIAVMREFGPSPPNGSDLRWSARFAADNVVQSYRGFKHEWHATPKTDPNLVVVAGSGGTGCSAGYVSWNGATDVEAWVVYEGPDQSHLSRAGRVGFKGFETDFVVGEACVQVIAVVDGKECKRSNIACTEG